MKMSVTKRSPSHTTGAEGNPPYNMITTTETKPIMKAGRRLMGSVVVLTKLGVMVEREITKAARLKIDVLPISNGPTIK
jgi:hypothetical protein